VETPGAKRDDRKPVGADRAIRDIYKRENNSNCTLCANCIMLAKTRYLPMLPPQAPPAIAHWRQYYLDTPRRTHDREVRYAKLIQKYSRSSSYVLDSACGFGFLLKELRALGISAFGIDLHADKFAAELHPDLRPYLIVGDAMSLCVERGRLGAITSVGFLEHVAADAFQTFLQEYRSALESGGILLVHMPVRSIATRLVRFVRLNVLHELSPLSIDDDNDQTHQIWWTIGQYEDAFLRAGYRIVESDVHLHRSSKQPYWAYLSFRWIELLSAILARTSYLRSMSAHIRRYFAFSCFFVLRKT
jgi:SAM-dependent methyltransferase